MAKRILVVEDEAALARLVQVNLEAVGYRVAVAESGSEALQCLAAELPDLMILDVVIPGPDGFEVLRQVRSDPASGGLPVIMLTGKSDEASIFQGWAEGVNCYMTKPFDPKDLLDLVARALSEMDGDDTLLV